MVRVRVSGWYKTEGLALLRLQGMSIVLIVTAGEMTDDN